MGIMRDDPIQKAAMLLMSAVQRMISEPKDAAAFASHAADHLTALSHAIADEAAEKAAEKVLERQHTERS